MAGTDGTTDNTTARTAERDGAPAPEGGEDTPRPPATPEPDAEPAPAPGAGDRTGAAGTAGGAGGARRRGGGRVLDMVLSLGAILLVALVIYLFIPHDDDGGPPIKRVDYSVELLTARRTAPYPVAAPEGLPHAWKPTSVRYDGADDDAWHLGYQDPKGQYVAVEQSTGDPSAFIDDAAQGAHRTGTTQRVDGRVWRRYEGAKYDALVLPGKNATTVVTGTASFQRLTEMARALKMSSAAPDGSESP